ncbi:MAG TPA: response regulator [Candidatus Paceibacterota bacterium]
MSILAGKSILIVGDETPGLHELDEALREQQMKVFHVTCGRITAEDLGRQKHDIVIINHLHEGNVCNLLGELKESPAVKSLPVFSLVENREVKIQAALLNGAADYVTVDEDPASIIKKIKSIFGQPDTFSSSSILDIPPDTADVTTKGIRVYIVEDDPLLRNLLDVRLQNSSFPHEFAVDGKDVLPKVRAFKPQVIILDLMLPQKSGFEILQEMKADPELKKIPVIVFSNRDAQQDKQRVFQLGAERFYVKAMTDLSLLIETIEELVAN